MKNLNIIIILAIASLAQNAFAGLSCLEVKKYDWSKKGDNFTKIGFSIKNMSKNGILFNFTNPSSRETALKFTLKPDEYREFPIDINKQTSIEIIDPTNRKILYKADFNTGKTIYVAWERNALRPRNKGLSGATGECLSLAKNVSPSDIKVQEVSM